MTEIISSANLMGGLGNQMFQIANALSQGWKNNVQTKFRFTDYKPLQGNPPKNYYNNIFRNIKFENNLPRFKTIHEKNWNLSNLNVIFDQSIEFHGFYQSSRNFLEFGDKIRDIFSPSDDFIRKITEKYPQIRDENTVSIHVRRGDYLKSPSIHPVIDISYINKSIEKMGDYSHLLVFSDDFKWVKSNINQKNMLFINGLSDYEEMWLMSLCKNNIISNSTFSWWASFLNKNQNKKITAPSIWFGPNGPNPHNNIYENYWVVIPVQYKNGILISN